MKRFLCFAAAFSLISHTAHGMVAGGRPNSISGDHNAFAGVVNPASTLWRTASDQKNKVYFFDSATSPNTFWLPLVDLDFHANAPIKKLDTAGGKIYAGNAAKSFVEAKPFAVLPAKP